MNRITAHPDHVLRAEFLQPLSLTAQAPSIVFRVSPSRISEILAEERSVTADTALRLARYFGPTTGFWMSSRAAHDLFKVKAEAGAKIKTMFDLGLTDEERLPLARAGSTLRIASKPEARHLYGSTSPSSHLADAGD